MAVRVRPAISRSDREAFIAVAHRVHAGQARWAALPDQEIRWALDPRMSPFIAENDIVPMVAWENGEPVGRIVAIRNHAHLAKHQDSAAHFGMLEAVDDPAVFAGLTQAATAFAVGHGLRKIVGPFSLSINHEAGLLIEGFDEPHIVRTNHAPPYYARALESLGFRKAMDLLAASCDVTSCDFPKRFDAVMARSGEAGAFTTRGLSFLRWSRDFPRVLALYNDAWAENWGATPVSAAEARAIAMLMLPVIHPRWVRVAEHGGEIVAVVCLVPDVNEALLPMRGRLAPFGWAKLGWAIHRRGTRRARIPMIGVARKWRGTRVGSLAVSRLMAEAIVLARAAGVEEVEISWMLETNHAVLNMVDRLPARRSRRFRIYERDAS